MKFGRLAAKFYQSLLIRKIPKDSLVACLMGFNCLSKVYRGSNPSLFRKQRRKFEDSNTTVETVWRIIGEYFSFFDYEVLEVITDILGTEEDKEDFLNYKKDFEEYVKQRLFTSQTLSESSISSNEENTVLFKLDNLYDDCAFGCLKRLQARISSILKLNKGVLQLRNIKDGCVLLVFEVPEFIVEHIFPLSAEQESALQELGVTGLDCGDYHFAKKV